MLHLPPLMPPQNKAWHSEGRFVYRAAEGKGDMAAFATRIGPFMKKDVAACLEQAAERGVDAGLLIDVVRRGPLPLV